MLLLNSLQIRQKIERMAIEILENNFAETELTFAGINQRGMELAQRLRKAVQTRSPNTAIQLVQIKLNPAAPLEQPVRLSVPPETLVAKAVIIVDDVANTGRTAFYALQPLMHILPKKVEVAVLVARKHKSFPVQPDYVGLSLATTMDENISVNILQEEEEGVFLD